MEPADDNHHHLPTHNRSDDIDNAQAAPDDGRLDNDQRRAIDELINSALDVDDDQRRSFNELVQEFGHHPRASELRAAFVNARDVLDECIAIIDGERQPENDPRIGDDRGVVE